MNYIYTYIYRKKIVLSCIEEVVENKKECYKNDTKREELYEDVL